MISIGAMSIFMTLGWNALGGWGGFVTALLYAVLALALTHWFLARKQLEVPAGITATLAVVMVPLAIFGAQMALGYWGENKPFRDYHVFIDWRWIMMEFGTLAVGAILLWRYRFPFMLMPVAVTLWYMSMDIVPFLFGAERVYDWEIRKFISLWFGLAMVLVAFWVDLRSRLSRDYAFWLYLFGVLAFWGGLSLMKSGSELGKLGYCGINVAMILLGAVIGRRVFAVFGGFPIARARRGLQQDLRRAVRGGEPAGGERQHRRRSGCKGARGRPYAVRRAAGAVRHQRPSDEFHALQSGDRRRAGGDAGRRAPASRRAPFRAGEGSPRVPRLAARRGRPRALCLAGGRLDRAPCDGIAQVGRGRGRRARTLQGLGRAGDHRPPRRPRGDELRQHQHHSPARSRRPATRDRRGGTEANRCRARNSHARGVGPAGVRGDAVAGPGRALGHVARNHPSSERPRFAGARAPGGRAPHGEPRRRGAPDDARAVRRIRARRERKVGGHHPALPSAG